MSSLEILTLGAPAVRLDGRRVAVKPKKALALLVYLAAAERPCPRDAPATLLWPDNDQRQARAALRRRLSELAAAIGAEWLLAEEEEVSLNPAAPVRVDLREFAQALAECRSHGHAPEAVCAGCVEPLEAAARLYRDDFLAGFTLADCPEFDDWQFFQAESLRRELASVLARLVQFYRSQDNAAAAVAHARRWVALDPLHEPAHRALMRAYAETNQRAAALRQYELCAKTLEAELGVPPEAETTDLYHALRTVQPSPPRSQPLPVVSVPQAQPAPPAPPQDEVRIATVLDVEVDARAEDDWDRRPDVTAAALAEFLRHAPDLLGRYQAVVTHSHDSGLQALFGLAELHEDDAERAVYAALALQEAAQAQALAIAAGISTGMVYVSHAPQDGKRSVTGPAVNLALRLKGQAPFGHVLAGAPTHYQTEQAFRFSAHELAMPGRVQPETVYRVERPRRHAVKSRGLGSLHAPLIGRDAELAKLAAALDKLPRGQGYIFTICGEAGLGKSRLVAELQTAASNRFGAGDPIAPSALLWLEGRCLEMNHSVAYWPFVDILQTFFGWLPQTPEAERAARVTAVLDELVQQQGLTQEQIDLMGPILGRLLSLRFGNDWDQRLQSARPEQIRYQTFETLRSLLAALARRRLLVLVLEDLHWADPLSLELVAHLLDLVNDHPLLLLCVYRPEAALEQDKLTPLAVAKCPAAFSEIRLRELTPDHSRALVEALLHVEGLTSATKERILATCQGNPFFLEEVIHDLIEAGLVYREGDVWRARQEIETTPVPARVQSVILARVDRLEPEHRQVLRQAAVIGRLFAPQVLAAALPPEISLPDALAALEGRAFIYPEQTIPTVVYSFRHVLAQEAVYATIPGRRRAALHAAIGQALEQVYGGDLEGELENVVDQLAFHYDRSDSADKAIVFLLRAGDKAARAYLTETAATHYRRALQRIDEVRPLPAPPQWRMQALSGLGYLYFRTSQYDDADRYLRQAIAWGQEHALPSKELARLHFSLSDLLVNWQGHFDEALPVAQAGLALLDDKESTEAAMLYGAVAFGYWRQGDMAHFRETARRLAGFLERVPYAEGLRVAYGAVMEAYGLDKDRDRWLPWLARASELARRYHDDWALSEHEIVHGYDLLFHGGDRQATVDAMQHSIQLAERVGDPKRVNWAQISLGDVLIGYGAAEQAEQQLRQSLAPARDFNPEYVHDVLLLLALSCLAQGKWQEAEDALREAQHLLEARKLNTAVCYVPLGYIALGRGEQAAAGTHFSTALDRLPDPDSFPRLGRKWGLRVSSYFANALHGLERAMDDPAAFAAFCDQCRAVHPACRHAIFTHWYAEPATIQPFSPAVLECEPLATSLAAGWEWQDPDGGCSCALEDKGLTLTAPVLRHLWFWFVNAPRWMRGVTGDFAAQVVCAAACADRPGIGGILLWQDGRNHLRLCVGVRSQDEASLEGSINGNDIMVGRGILASEKIILRLERIGSTVRGLGSVDGAAWFCVGEVDFPANEQLQVGLCAIGQVDRTVYHAPYADGTAIRFTDFRLWQ